MIMHWNHRVVKTVESDGLTYFMLREVYYDDEGNPDSHGHPFMHAETLDGLRMLATQLTEALDKPILEDEDFPKGTHE